MITKTGSEVLEKKAFLGILAKGFGSLGKRALPKALNRTSASSAMRATTPVYKTSFNGKNLLNKMKRIMLPNGTKEITNMLKSPLNIGLGSLMVGSGMSSVGGYTGGMVSGAIGGNIGKALATKIAPNSKALQGVGGVAGNLFGWTLGERLADKYVPIYKRKLPKTTENTNNGYY